MNYRLLELMMLCRTPLKNTKLTDSAFTSTQAHEASMHASGRERDGPPTFFPNWVLVPVGASPTAADLALKARTTFGTHSWVFSITQTVKHCFLLEHRCTNTLSQMYPMYVDSDDSRTSLRKHGKHCSGARVVLSLWTSC